MGHMTGASSGIVINAGNAIYNESSADQDFRIESDGQTHMLFVDAGNDRIGIGTANPDTMLHLEHSGAGSPTIKIENTGTESSEPEIIFQRSGAASSSLDIGHIKWKAKDSGGGSHIYASIYADAQDETAGTEDGRILFLVTMGGTDSTEILRLSGSEGAVFNDGSKDIDFRVESNGNANMLFVDATNDRVAIGTDTPLALFEAAGAAKLRQGAVTSQGSGTTLTAVTHAGNYIIATGDNDTISLPSTSTIGEQYCFIATHSNGCTIGRNGNNLNGATSDIAVAQYKAKTAVAIGSNDWVIIG